MNLKTEKAINNAVSKTTTPKWDKLKKFGIKALLATVSTISIATGMLGSSQQMQAQAPQNYVTVSADNLDAYLKGTRNTTTQQQYAEIYANRNAYRQQQTQTRSAYASPQWLAERGYELDLELSRNLSDKYLGAFLNCNKVDRFGIPTEVVYLPVDPIHEKIETLSMESARKAARNPGGDTLGIYANPSGNGLNGAHNTFNDVFNIIYHTVGHRHRR